MQPSKWERVLNSKPLPVLEHLLDEAARLFATDLSAWPPSIDEFDPATGPTVATLIRETPERPDARLYAEAFRLTRIDLSRELEAYDDYFRNQRYLESGLEPKDKGLLLFVSRFMAEQLLGLSEATAGRVSRPKLLEILEKTRRYFFASPTPK